MRNSHYAVIVRHGISMEVIAAGPEEYCENALRQWIAKSPLDVYETAEVLQFIQEVSA